ncbi:hypothetical protein RI129_001620 [Pyrocoelia pectoralis]|uniref:Centrosome-associated zinc finger protein CP190 n=1 Tax=Pyrocoelia pectoralis TaxID=417401 RepID=A0AAN7VU91_9COLE
MGSHQHTKMGEGSKQVRVDNWGIFFLQRLEMFFNKTDYCDLTLQFEGNVQLKVHRLVMNACTDYFHVLEQTCQFADDVLIMPSDLQADVVLPIVNFMYTGMLEFHMSMYDKLYKTANLMNITVLTKLLDAQKTPIQPLPKPTHKKNAQVPHTWNLQGKKISAKTMDPDLPAPLPGRKIPVWKRKSAPSTLPPTLPPNFYQDSKKQSLADPLAYFDNAPKPTRFEWPDDEIASLNVFDGAFDDISYTSKPLMTKNDEPKPSTSFDCAADSNRLSPDYDDTSIDTDDMKDYVKEQKIRSSLTEEDYEDNIDNDFNTRNSLKRKSSLDQTSSKKVRFNANEKENQKGPKISITPTGKLTSDVDHTKIISEVLRKYPNLVKKNKNIRLKILSKMDNASPTPVALEQVMKPILKKQIRHQPVGSKGSGHEEKTEEGPWRCDLCSTPNEPLDFVLYYLYRKHMTDMHHEKFDSRLCKYCGHKTTKHNLLMYHQYTRHGIRPPPAYKFPKCNSCPYIALSETLLIKHKLNHSKHELQCIECKVAFTNQQALNSHSLITGHNGKLGKNSFDCQYCTKKFHSGSTLFTHIKMQHREEARRDGIVSIDEVDDTDDDDDDQAEYIVPEIRTEKKRNSEADSLNNVASGIATSLGLVDVVVLDENEQYILHANNQQSISAGESEFILPDLQDARFTTTQQVIAAEPNVITQSMLHNTDITSTDELVMVLTDHDYGDSNNEIMSNENSNIVVLYSHPIEGQENQFITSQGNIMLTSQAGIIELRNTNTVVSSTGPFVNDVHSPQIESIEMIQREINQHPNVTEEQELSADIVTLANKENKIVENSNLEDTSSVKSGNNDVRGNENNEMKANENDNEEAGETEAIPSTESDDQALVTPEEAVNDQKELSEIADIAAEHQNCESSVEEQPKVPSEENVDVTATKTAVLEEENTENLDEVQQENIPTEECLENIPTEECLEKQPDDVNCDVSNEEPIKETSVIENSTDNVDNLVNDNDKPMEEVNSQEEELPEKVEKSPRKEDIQDEETQNENTTEVETSEVTPESVPHVDTPEVSQSSEAESSVENVQEKQVINHSDEDNTVSSDEPPEKVSKLENETNTNLATATPDKSAKIILEDWEDTDSQQSDTKSTNVNKLIDDWDDDEDDKKN